MTGVDYEALARQYGGTVNDSPPITLGNAASRIPGDSAETLARNGYGARITDAGEPLTPYQGAQAVATGFNRSILSTLPGLPVKTALDVADLARAIYGYTGGKLGYLKPDQLPAPLDRAGFVGSPEWIAAQLQKTTPTAALINNPRPDNPAARILNAGGAAVGASLAGRPSDVAMQFASGVAGQGASEFGLPPEWAMLGSMGPQAAGFGAAAATRGVVRGGEAGRQAMEQRNLQFQNAGVTPSVGLASGGRVPQAMESLLSKVPGGAGVMAGKAADINAQMGTTMDAARDAVSPVYGPAVAGQTIKQGIADYRARQQDIYGRMLDRVDAAILPGSTFPVGSMLARGNATLPQIPGAPNVSAVLSRPLGFTQDVVGALGKDAAPRPPMPMPSPILGPNGAPFTTMAPAVPGGLPFSAIKGLRTAINQQAYPSNPLAADANTGALKYLAGGGKQDLYSAAAQADAQRVASGQAPAVLPNLQRADRFYAASQDQLDQFLSPLYKAGEPASERSYARVESDLQNSGQNVARFMSSMPLDARRQFAATAMDRMGRASPGQQDATGTAFSPQTFLTNWNRIDPAAKDALLRTIPNGSNVRAKLDSLAQAASMLRDSGKVFANPSGTTPAAALVGTGAGIGGGMFAAANGHLVPLGSVLTSLALANMGARGMTNPRFVNWLSQTTQISPQRFQQHLLRLSQTASMEAPDDRAAMQRFVNELNAELRGRAAQ